MNRVTDQLRSFRFEENNDVSNDLEDIISCKYYNIDHFKNEKFSILPKGKNFLRIKFLF